MAKCLGCYKDELAEGKYYHPDCAWKVFGTKEPPELNYSLSEMKELAKKIIQGQGIMTGVQPKISLGLEKAGKERGKLTLMMGDFILKPPSQNYKEMPETEDLTMHLAEICKINTVLHALIPLASGELSYITRRVDRSAGSKIHMEDFCQLSELLTEDKYKSSMESVGKLTGKFSMYPGLDLVNLFELTIFNYVTGNNDMHLKNFSLIDHGEGWQMSPAYDLLNVNLVNEKDNEESALTINGKKRKLKKQDFLQLGTAYKLNEAQIRNAFNKILGKEEQMLDFIKISFLTGDYKTKYIQIVKTRCRALKEKSPHR
ncbi:MAG TPA: HipA domain-containing protein [Chryseolinea sp.]